MTQHKQTNTILRNRNIWVLAVLLFLLYAGTARAETEAPGTAEPESEAREQAIETHSYSSLQSGYRFITPDGPSAAASCRQPARNWV